MLPPRCDCEPSEHVPWCCWIFAIVPCMKLHEKPRVPGAAADWRKRVRGAVSWLRCPEVFRHDGPNGPAGFVDWVDRESSVGEGFLYPEITGYAVSVLEWSLRVGSASGWEAGASHDAVKYLTKRACDSSGAVASCGRGGVARFRYTFDTAMVLKGLCAYYQRTHDAHVLETMHRCAGYVRSRIDTQGVIAPWESLASCDVPKTSWSSRAGAYLSKAMLALACLSRLTGASDVLERLDTVLGLTLDYQDSAGFFPLPGRSVVHLHGHLYACEGLFLLGCLQKDDRLRASARRGTQAALGIYAACGRLPASIGPGFPIYAERSDVVAQLLRLCMLTNLGTSAQREALAGRLAAYQIETAAGYGGLRFGRDINPDTGQVIDCIRHINTWSTLFAAQAWAALAVPEWPGLWVNEPWFFA